jgi:hypothetical protein
MPGAQRRGVFLSYRRDDAGPYARSLQLQLSQRIPGARIFMDLDSIEPGLDFAEVIEEAVNSSAVLVALIGKQWLTLTGDDGTRRLDNPDDYVRFEIKTALKRGVRVIPVLIDGARPLRQEDLPEELHKLARLNAHKLSYDRYQDDADRLLDVIERVLAKVGEERLAGEERERLDRKGGGKADPDDPEELARQYQEAQEAAAPGGTAAFIPWVHVPSEGDLTATPDSGTVAIAATADQAARLVAPESDRLTQLTALHEQGLLSTHEFTTAKDQLLGMTQAGAPKLDQLTQLAALHEQGLLSTREFTTAKNKLFGGG